MKTISRICETCNLAFDADQKEVNRGNGRFCSLRCSARRQKASTKVPNCKCANCGASFYRNASKQKLSKHGFHFCSRKCKDQAQRIGGIDEIRPSHYSSGVGVYRQIAKRHYMMECSGCGYNKHEDVIQIHHRDANRANNDPTNLIPLCPTCHVEVHRGHRVLKLVPGEGIEPPTCCM